MLRQAGTEEPSRQQSAPLDSASGHDDDKAENDGRDDQDATQPVGFRQAHASSNVANPQVADSRADGSVVHFTKVVW